MSMATENRRDIRRGAKRPTSFGSLTITVVEGDSSPSMTGFEWNPDTYHDAEKHVEMARSRTGVLGKQLSVILPEAVRQKQAMIGPDAGLSCPAPANDPEGEYRVGLDASDEPQIQRRDSNANAWVSASELMDAVRRRQKHLEDTLGSLEKFLAHRLLPENERAVVQAAHDGIRDVLNEYWSEKNS